MSVLNHVFDVPTDEELAAIVGAATPHFALQSLIRVKLYLDALPPDHPRRAAVQAQVERLEGLAVRGERAGDGPSERPRLIH